MTQLSEALPAHVVNTSDVQVYDHIGALCRIIANGSMTGGAYSMVEERARAGYMAPRHVHEREAETFIVLSGELEGWVAGTVSRVTEGNLVYLPANLEHAFRIVSPSAHFLTLITPAGFESFFEDSGIALQQDFRGTSYPRAVEPRGWRCAPGDPDAARLHDHRTATVRAGVTDRDQAVRCTDCSSSGRRCSANSRATNSPRVRASHLCSTALMWSRTVCVDRCSSAAISPVARPRARCPTMAIYRAVRP